MSHGKMNGRTVIITGGAGAVGSSVTQRWLGAGASIVIVDHRQSTIDRWLSKFSKPEWNGRIATLATDVTTEDGALRMVHAARDEFGVAPDTLIHLVGGFAAAAVEDDDSRATLDRMMSLNLLSAFQCYRAVLPAFRERKSGWIVGMTSKAAADPGPRLFAYAASKSGLEALTSSLAAETRKDGIHVNLIAASTIDTQANRDAMGDAKAANWVTPDDIAEATLFLCSDRARAVNGTILEVFANA